MGCISPDAKAPGRQRSRRPEFAVSRGEQNKSDSLSNFHWSCQMLLLGSSLTPVNSGLGFAAVTPKPRCTWDASNHVNDRKVSIGTPALLARSSTCLRSAMAWTNMIIVGSLALQTAHTWFLTWLSLMPPNAALPLSFAPSADDAKPALESACTWRFPVLSAT